jgi:methyl-accepting chemotaxis protein/ABC-type sugar transport system substrate-binding protein
MRAFTTLLQLLQLILLALLGASFLVSALEPARPIVVIVLVVSVLVSAWHTLFYLRPRLRNATNYLASIDQRLLAPLRHALSELAIGDLTVRAKREDVDVAEEEARKPDPLGVHAAARRFEGSLRQMHEDFSMITATPIERLCYVGSNSYLEGCTAGLEVVKRLPQAGIIIAAVPSTRFANFVLRVKGFQNALAEAHNPLSISDVWEFHESRDEINQQVDKLADSGGSFDVLYIADGNAPPTYVEALKRRGLLDGKLIIAHDTMPETMALVKSGEIAATISQEPYRQGYDPVVHVFNRIVAGVVPDAPRLLTKLQVIDRENADAEQVEEDSLPELVEQPLDKEVRILFVGLGDKGFWEPVARAVADVRKKVEERGSVLDWIVPEGALLTGDRGADVMVPVVDKAVRDKYQGVIIPVSDERTVLAVNRATDLGIEVATYNCEPISFRGLVAEVLRHAAVLQEVGDGVAASVEESRQALASIHQTVERVSTKARLESEGISELTGQLGRVSEDVANSSKLAATSTETARDVRTQSEGGRSAVEETADVLGQFRAVSEESTRALAELTEGISEITDILRLIQDMAEQTNVLAINAAIEAARAGESGAGFQIVSGEIRGFAEDSRVAVDRISSIIGGVREQTKRVEVATQQVRGQAEQSLERIAHAQAALQTISQNSSTNAQNLSAIVESVTSMQGEADRVTQRLSRLAGEFHATTDAMAEIASSTREMTEQSQALAETALKLRRSVHSIESVVSQFVLE